MLTSPKQMIEVSSKALELAGVSCIMFSALAAVTKGFINSVREKDKESAYRNFRRRLGNGILVGLEFLVAADIVRTVAIEPDLGGVIVLAVIVLIRTFLSFSLEVETTGRWPWQQ